MQGIQPCLWFDQNAEEAVEFYCGVFPNSEITGVTRYGPAGPGPEGSVMTMKFRLDGRDFTAINGGPYFQFNEAVSFIVPCETQAEVDHYWERLCEGGAPVECGWLKDRFGVSWQVVPTVLGRLLSEGEPEQRQRVMQALLGMQKLEIEVLERAHGQGQ